MLTSWIVDVVKSHGKGITQLRFNFVSRGKIVDINTTYLNHQYPTDIITFDYSEDSSVAGEVYICPDVVCKNASAYGVTFVQELSRVIIHGVLHLVGFNDSTAEEKTEMRKIEDVSLSLLVSYENEI